MSGVTKKLTTVLAPVFGAGAIGVCPLCWAGSASLLTYLGLAGIIPYWRWISYAIFGLGVIGFLFDYRSHGNPYPLVLLTLGAVLVEIGAKVTASGIFLSWLFWGSGGLLVTTAIIYNRWLFRKLPGDVKKAGLNAPSGAATRSEE